MESRQQTSSNPAAADPAEQRAATVRRLRLMSGTDDLAFARVVDLMIAKLHTTGAGLFIAGREELLHRVSRGPLDGEYSLDSSMFRFLLTRSEPLMVSDCMGDSRLANCIEVSGPPHVRFLAAVPVRAPNDCVVGGVYAYDHMPRFRLRSTLQLLYTLQRQVEDALLIREHERLDLLTRLLQPRAFVSSYLQAWRESLKRNLPIRLSMLRVEGLQALNRLPGRNAVDAVLVQLADLLRERSPKGSLVGRLGGNLYGISFAPSASDSAVEQFSSQIQWAFKNLVRQSPYPREAALQLSISNVELAPQLVPEVRPLDVLKATEIQLLSGEAAPVQLTPGRIKMQLEKFEGVQINEIERNLSPWPVGGRVV